MYMHTYIHFIPLLQRKKKTMSTFSTLLFGFSNVWQIVYILTFSVFIFVCSFGLFFFCVAFSIVLRFQIDWFALFIFVIVDWIVKLDKFSTDGRGILRSSTCERKTAATVSISVGEFPSPILPNAVIILIERNGRHFSLVPWGQCNTSAIMAGRCWTWHESRVIHFWFSRLLFENVNNSNGN